LGAPDRPFSGGVVADGGYDLVHARFARPIGLAAGLAAAARQVDKAGRTVHAIAGFELRIPKPLTEAEFAGFNEVYVAQLKGLGLEIDGLMPAARTNVAAMVGGVSEPSVYAVSYTVPAVRTARAFVLSGAPEEESGDAATMLDSIMRVLALRLEEIGASWSDATAIQLYGIDDVQAELVDRALSRTGQAAVHGIHWFPSRPPIVGLKLEIDVRSAGLELVVGS
jgi:hypothetical protein